MHQLLLFLWIRASNDSFNNTTMTAIHKWGQVDDSVNDSFVFTNFCFSDARPAASLTASPDREKHFTSQNVSLKCDGKSTDGRIRYYRQINTQSYLYDCSTWWTVNESSCIVNSQSDHQAVYWCESGSEFSNAVNLTIYSRLLYMNLFLI